MKSSYRKGYLAKGRKPKFLIGFFILTFVMSMTLQAVPSHYASAAPADIFSDGFESGNLSGWTSSGTNWSVVSTNANSGSEKAVVIGATLGDELVKEVPTTGYGSIELSYAYKIKESLEATDHVYVEWYDGSTWTSLADYTGLTAGDWISASHTLPSGAEDNSDFAFRFRAVLGSATSDRFDLDDVLLTGELSATPSPSPSPSESPSPSPSESPSPSPSPSESPSPTPGPLGSITVCKIIIDEDGNITDGSELPGEIFFISGFTPDPVTSVGVPIGELGTAEFETPLDLDNDLIGNDEDDDAECVLFDDLEIGGYYYDEEVLPSNNWVTPLYNDQYITPIEDLNDFFPYNGLLFDGDAGNDALRNQDVDGHIVLTLARPNRTLVVLNQISEQEEQQSAPTPTPTPNGGGGVGGGTDEQTPSPTPSLTPTPTPNGSGGGSGGGSGFFPITSPTPTPPAGGSAPGGTGGGSTGSPTPTPAVLGEMTELPNVSLSVFDSIFLSLLMAFFMTGMLSLMFGYEIMPRKTALWLNK